MLQLVMADGFVFQPVSFPAENTAFGRCFRMYPSIFAEFVFSLVAQPASLKASNVMLLLLFRGVPPFFAERY